MGRIRVPGRRHRDTVSVVVLLAGVLHHRAVVGIVGRLVAGEGRAAVSFAIGLVTFVPRNGTSLGSVLRSFDDRARSEGLVATTHRDGHCAVTSADDGQVVMVWKGDTTANQVRFRALYVSGTQPELDRCTAAAGPRA